jgi:hypothetical protein
MTNPAEFGTGLRAHLGLEPDVRELPLPEAVEPVAALLEPHPAPVVSEFETLAELESELLERERVLAAREAALETRAAAVLAQAQALYAEFRGDVPAQRDELAHRRERRQFGA